MSGRTTRQSSRNGTDEASPESSVSTPPLRALYPVGEAAVLMGVSRRQTFYYIESGELRSVKISKKCRRVPIDAINEWLAQHNVRTTVQEILRAPQSANEPALAAA